MSQLELNKGDNFLFGVDVSASMQAKDCNGMSRIDFLKEKLSVFTTEAAKWDEDGIDVLSFGQTVKHYPGVTAEKANTIIGGLKATEGQTRTDELIRQAYQIHKAGGYKQSVLFIATDGAPSDPAAVKKAIIDITNDIKDEHEFAISVLTVGEIDSGLAAFLTDLDDNLEKEGAKHDIVDVKPLMDVDFVEAFSGALHD